MIRGTIAVLYTVRDKFLQVVHDLGNNINLFPIVLGLMGEQDLRAAGITQVQRQPYLDLRGQGVLLGFVDTGIDYTQNAFVYEDNTSKIQYIWDQTLSEPGSSPKGYYFGSEFTQTKINEALNVPHPFDVVPHRDDVGHGTFLASVAGSREPNEYLGAAPDAEIIMVKLRKSRQYYIDKYLVPQDQQNVYESSDLMLGVEYILAKAYALRRPVAICIGLGSNLSGHDGFCVLDEFLADVANISAVAICTAMGNENNMRHHTQGRIQQRGQTQTIEVKCGEENGDIYVNIWTFSSDRVSVSVTSPTGEVVGRVPARNGTIYETGLVLERARVAVEYFFPIPRSGSQLTTVKIIRGTPGIWKITVYGDIINNGEYHGWLPITGFVDPQTEFLEPSPRTTLTVPASSMGVISCAAYNAVSKGLYVFSSWGPPRVPLVAPDLAAPGVNVTGVFPGGYGTMSGTSVSVAITTGACALMLQWGIVEKNEPTLNSYLIRSYLIKGCDRDENVFYPSVEWGYGRLDLYNTFTLMRS